MRIFTHGGIVGIVLPALHMQEVAGLYAALTGTNAEILMAMTALLLPVWMAGFAIYVLASLRYGALRGAIMEIGVLCYMAGLLPPLAGFAVYFCLVHSRRHFLFIWTAMQQMLSRQKISDNSYSFDDRNLDSGRACLLSAARSGRPVGK